MSANNHIILIGYRGTGKTSVGRKLAETLGLPSYDTDQMIMDRLGKTIKDWVEEKGWEAFRQEENTIIRELSSLRSGVVSLGGGAVMDPGNREQLRLMGLIVWLTADIETILTRMEADPHNTDNRPPLSEKDWENETREILNQRLPLYQQLADFSIDTDGKKIGGIVEEIIHCLQQTQRNK